jgi:hypothetical protein
MADCILFVLGFGKLLTVPNVIESIERNLESLAADRKLVTSEHHPATDFYGHAAVFKRFAGKRMDRSLRVSIEHGVRFDLSYWAGDYSAGQTVSFVPSRWRKDVLHGQVDKVIRAVGPYIHYTPGLYPAEDVARVCQKMGKTLVVFPAHSTHWIDSDYDVGAFCRRLQMERDRLRPFSSVFTGRTFCAASIVLIRKQDSPVSLPGICSIRIFCPVSGAF